MSEPRLTFVDDGEVYSEVELPWPLSLALGVIVPLAIAVIVASFLGAVR